ncbi:MAG: phosphomannomutase/phosphoglucomutase [Candidatus Sericytochromatia bacterium]
MTIFKAYDIRGLYPQEINEDIAYRIGKAFVDYLGCKTVVIGRDMRTSSPAIFEKLSQGITEQGADIFDIGMSTTDMYYFAVEHLGSDAGIMITASHNPGQYNGLKLVRSHAIPIGGDSGIKDIEAIYQAGEFKPSGHTGQIIAKEGILDEYVKYIHKLVELDKIKPLRVVMDAGNGMAGLVAPKMFAGTPIEVIPMFFEPDGSFPNHEANPLVEENRLDLIAKVKETGADFGVGFDGDSDRAFFVDDLGQFVDGDFITGRLGAYLLQRHPGATIFYDVRGSRYVREVIEAAGGHTFMWKVGHAFMKAKMKQTPGAIMGGEVSGHFYFKFTDEFYADNSALPVFYTAAMISQENQPLSEIMAARKNYFISGEINSEVRDPDAVMAEIRKRYGDKGEVVEIDGLSIIADTWWISIRKSNTEPLVRLNCEADSQENMEKLRDEVLAIIRG